MLITLKPHVTDPRTQLRHIHNLYTRLVDLATWHRLTGQECGWGGRGCALRARKGVSTAPTTLLHFCIANIYFPLLIYSK